MDAHILANVVLAALVFVASFRIAGILWEFGRGASWRSVRDADGEWWPDGYPVPDGDPQSWPALPVLPRIPDPAPTRADSGGVFTDDDGMWDGAGPLLCGGEPDRLRGDRLWAGACASSLGRDPRSATPEALT